MRFVHQTIFTSSFDHVETCSCVWSLICVSWYVSLLNSPVGDSQQTFILLNVLHCTIEKEEEFLNAARKVVRETNKEDGCIFYNFHKATKLGSEKKQSNLLLYCIMERWESQAHVNAHMQAPHFKEFFKFMASTNYGPKPPGIELFICNQMIVPENQLQQTKSKL